MADAVQDTDRSQVGWREDGKAAAAAAAMAVQWQ